MNSLEKKLADVLEEGLKVFLKKEGLSADFLTDYHFIFEHPKNEAFGDLSCNVCFDLVRSGLIREFKPFEMAQNLVLWLNAKDPSLESRIYVSAEAAGGGFINFYLKNEFLVDESIKKIIYFDQIFPKSQKQYLVEYSSPNIAKPFTIGHLRSTIIGDAVANLLDVSGFSVYRDNHLGDWGTQFGKQIYALEKWGNLEEIAQAEDPIKELVALYVRFHREAEANPDLNDQARAYFQALEKGDTKLHQLWQFCIDVSMKEFSRIYNILGVQFTENGGRGYGESFFVNQVPEILVELDKKQITTDSEGAKLVFFPEDKFPPLMILKKDGSTIYATRDLATDKFRWQTYGQDLTIINEVGSEQSLYMKQLFETERMLGWFSREDQRVHIKHGMYRFKDRKMSTRKGDVIWLDDVLNEAFARVKQVTKANLSNSDIWKIAIGAIKWNDLSKESTRDINYDLDEIINLKGNSGPYLQYTFVRAWSILQKSPEFKSSEEDKILIDRYFSESKQLVEGFRNTDWQLDETELSLWRWLERYTESLSRAASEYATHILANYLYELATRFNTWYAKETILENQRKEVLTWLVAKTLKDGLKILGIEVVERM